jgi:hypothetical protein
LGALLGLAAHLQPFHMGVHAAELGPASWSVPGPLPGLVPLHSHRISSSSQLPGIHTSFIPTFASRVTYTIACPNSSAYQRQLVRAITDSSARGYCNPEPPRASLKTPANVAVDIPCPAARRFKLRQRHQPRSHDKARHEQKKKDARATDEMPTSLDSSRPIMAPSVRLPSPNPIQKPPKPIPKPITQPQLQTYTQPD